MRHKENADYDIKYHYIILYIILYYLCSEPRDYEEVDCEQNSELYDSDILFKRITLRAGASISAKHQIPLWIHPENIRLRLAEKRIRAMEEIANIFVREQFDYD
jgi:hypothetical protein